MGDGCVSGMRKLSLLR